MARLIGRRVAKSVVKRQAAVERKERDIQSRRASHLAKPRPASRPVLSPKESGAGGGARSNLTWATKKGRRS